MRRPLVSKGWPSASYSRLLHPIPAPTISRPPLIASTLARWLASQTGLCCGTTSTLVPRRTRDVTAAAQLSVANGSRRNGDG